MIYILLIVMIFANAGETIAYKNTKCKSNFNIMFGVTFWSFVLSLPLLFFYLLYKSDLPFQIANINLLFVLSISILSLITIVCWAKVSQNMPMSIAEGVSEIYIAFLTFFCWLIFGGRLTYLHAIIIALVVFLCIALAFLQNKKYSQKCLIKSKKLLKFNFFLGFSIKNNKIIVKKKNSNYKIGLIFLSVWVVLYVCKSILPRAVAQNNVNGLVYNFLLETMTFLFAIFLSFCKKMNFRDLFKTCLDKWLFLIGLCKTAAHSVILYLALKMNLGIVEAVSVFGIVIVMLYERFVMKEKLNILSYILLIFIAISTCILALI